MLNKLINLFTGGNQTTTPLDNSSTATTAPQASLQDTTSTAGAGQAQTTTVTMPGQEARVEGQALAQPPIAQPPQQQVRTSAVIAGELEQLVKSIQQAVETQMKNLMEHNKGRLEALEKELQEAQAREQAQQQQQQIAAPSNQVPNPQAIVAQQQALATTPPQSADNTANQEPTQEDTEALGNLINMIAQAASENGANNNLAATAQDGSKALTV